MSSSESILGPFPIAAEEVEDSVAISLIRPKRGDDIVRNHKTHCSLEETFAKELPAFLGLSVNRFATSGRFLLVA